VKKTGEPRGENHALQPGSTGGGVRTSASERFIIVDLPDNFDINQTFGSEQDVADGSAAAESSTPARPEDSRADSDLPVHARIGARSLLIADLLDNRVRLEWHEAVAIAQHLCGVMVRDPAANVHHSLVEPWNVEITNAGDIQVLPGGSSSDPLVKQVGRVLSTLLQVSIAPAELRLVASQASFEVPVYSSVEELSAALRRFERPGDLDAIRSAYQRGLDAKFSVAPARTRVAPAVDLHADDHSRPRKATPAPLVAPTRAHSPNGPRVALAGAAVVFAIALVPVIRSVMRSSDGEPAATSAQRQGERFETPPSAPPERRNIAPRPAPPTSANAAAHPAPSPVASTASHRPLKRAIGREVVTAPATPAARVAVSPQRRPASSGSNDSLEAERRAVGLLAAGNADDASIMFDAIVMRNPFYQLDPSRSSPEALAALQSSKRILLPVLARRLYEDARAAYEAGDFTKAIAAGGRALALLNSLDPNEPAPRDLETEATNLVALATAARTAEEDTIYSIGDTGVTPPRPLSRQLAATVLLRRSTPPTGRLEILVGRSGRVEIVRLDTPTNGYHDRMIVSAVKAWRYKPALRNGKPVRFNLVMMISLPES